METWPPPTLSSIACTFKTLSPGPPPLRLRPPRPHLHCPPTVRPNAPPKPRLLERHALRLRPLRRHPPGLQSLLPDAPLPPRLLLRHDLSLRPCRHANPSGDPLLRNASDRTRPRRLKRFDLLIFEGGPIGGKRLGLRGDAQESRSPGAPLWMGYRNQGRVGNARDMFDRMPELNVVSWTAMISGYFRAGMWEDGFRSFSAMRSDGVGINSTTLTVMTDVCACLGRLGEGMQIHELVLKAGFDHDVFLGNSLITMFSKSTSIENARKVFDLLVRKDILSWNSLLTGYVHNGRIEEAYELFQGMTNKDVVSWTTMVAGLLDGARIGEALRLLKICPLNMAFPGRGSFQDSCGTENTNERFVGLF